MLKGKILNKTNLTVFSIVLAGVMAAFLVYPSIWDRGADNLNKVMGYRIIPYFYNIPFRLGLDLRGGTHLVYEADLSNIDSGERSDAMSGLRDVIERRVNMFGVAEPVVQINKVGESYRLIVELAGITNVNQAIEMIGQTPYLEFREERPEEESEAIAQNQQKAFEKMQNQEELTKEEKASLAEDAYFTPTSLTGRYLKRADAVQNQQTYQWQVSLLFDDEGSKIFQELTKNNIGKRLAIYLDGAPISAPVVQDEIIGGKAQITGNFSVQEAQQLVQRLNSGALPVPISLINQQTVGASLGKISLDKSLKAGMWGLLAVLLFMIFYYRLSGVLASFALLIYILLILALFKLIPVTLTLAGIAGFILSIGMAVDANVLIFERFKEELKAGHSLSSSIDQGFQRAWPAIRDGNISTIITCLILFVFATGLVKGFALTLGIGVLVSMLSAIFVTKSFLKLFAGEKMGKRKWLWR